MYEIHYHSMSRSFLLGLPPVPVVQLGEGVHEDLEGAGHLPDEGLDLRLGVEDLHGLRVRVVAHGERTRDGRSELDELLLGVFEALRDVVYGLELSDGIRL